MSFIYKYTFTANIPGHGLSETYHFRRETDDITAVLTSLDDVTTKRIALLGAEAEAVALRLMLVEDEDDPEVTIKRIGRLVKFSRPGSLGNQSQTICEENVSLQLQFVTADNRHKKLQMMGGVYASVLPSINTYNPNGGAWATRFNAWVTAMQTARMGWLSDDSNPTKTHVVNYVMDPDSGFVTINLLAPGITWPNDDDPVSLRIDVQNRRSPLDGLHLVRHVSATQCVTVKPIGVAPYQTGQSIRVWVPEQGLVDLSPLQQGGAPGLILAQNAVTRKRGRPTYASRGRAPTNVQW